MLTDSKIRSTKPLAKSYKLFDSQGLYLTVRECYWLHPLVLHADNGAAMKSQTL